MDKKTLRRKADQEWDMAGLARQDNDMKAAAEHTEKAREYQRQLGELIRSGS
jgi:hypothetical protein